MEISSDKKVATTNLGDCYATWCVSGPLNDILPSYFQIKIHQQAPPFFNEVDGFFLRFGHSTAVKTGHSVTMLFQTVDDYPLLCWLVPGVPWLDFKSSRSFIYFITFFYYIYVTFFYRVETVYIIVVSSQQQQQYYKIITVQYIVRLKVPNWTKLVKHFPTCT